MSLFAEHIPKYDRTGFAGEILDVDGVTGGFNFQSAWTTGRIAGMALAGKAESGKLETGKRKPETGNRAQEIGKQGTAGEGR